MTWGPAASSVVSGVMPTILSSTRTCEPVGTDSMTAMPVVGVAGSFGSFDHIAENAGKYVRAVHPAPPTRTRNAATTAKRRNQGTNGS